MIDKNFQTYNSHLQGSRVQLSANHNLIATLGSDEIIFTIDNVLKQTNILQLKNQQKLKITAFTIAPMFQNSFVFGTADGVVKFMRPIHNLQLHKAQIIFQTINKTPITYLSFSSSGKYLGIATETFSIMYCMKSKNTLKLMNQQEGFVNRIDFGDDQYIFSIGNEGNIHFYSIKNQEKQKQQQEDISENLFGEMRSSIQLSFMANYKLAVEHLARKYFFLNACFCKLKNTQSIKKIVFASGNSLLQTIEIINQQSSYNIVRQVKQDSEILIVMPLNRGGNGKAITLALSTEKLLSIWNYSHLQKIFSINILEQLKKTITCIVPASQNMNPSFAFIIDNKDSNGMIYQFTNQAVLDISQNKVNSLVTHAIEQQKKQNQEQQQSEQIQEITPTMRLITAYPQFPLQKGYEEYNRVRFLFYNNIGCIIQRIQDTSSIMELQIHDKSRMRRMKLPRNKTFGLFCLKEKIFACANSREIIIQEEKQLKENLQPWQILWEEIQGIAVGGNWLAAINNEQIKIFDFASNELHTICFDRRYVTMQAYEDLLAVVYHGGLPAYGYQQLKVKIYKITTNSVTLDRDIIMPLKSKSILKWFGFSQQGMMVCQDSLEIVRAYSFNRNEWQIVYSLQGKQQCLFIQNIEGSVIFGFKLPHKRNERQQPKVLPRSLPTKIFMEWPNLKFQFFSFDQQKNLKTKILKNFILTHEEYRYQNWYKYKYSRRKDHPWYEQSKTIKNQEEIKTIKTEIDISLHKYLKKYLQKTQLKGEKYKRMISSLLLVCQREVHLEENRKGIKQLLSQGHNGGFISKETLSNIQSNLTFRPSIQTFKCIEKINQISVLQQMLSIVNYQIDLNNFRSY